MLRERVIEMVAITTSLLSMSTGTFAQERDYWDFCKDNRDLIIALGDGRSIEASTIDAQKKIIEMGVDLYDLLVWQLNNIDRVASLYTYPPYYQPGSYTIPAMLWKTGDKRALPYAKIFMSSEMKKYNNGGMPPSSKAVMYLMGLGWDDKESTTMLRDIILCPRTTTGLEAAYAAIQGIPTHAAIPDTIKQDIMTVIDRSDPDDPMLTGVITYYLSYMFKNPPANNEDLIALFDKCVNVMMKRSEREYVRYGIDAIVKSALNDYPMKNKLPNSLLDRLEALVNSDDFRAWGELSNQHLASLHARRKRDYGSMATVHTVGNNTVSVHPPDVPSIPEATHTDKSTSIPAATTAKNQSSLSWIRHAIAGLVVFILVACTTVIIQRRSRSR